MNLDVNVFDRRLIKRLFYYFFTFNFLVALISILLQVNPPGFIPGRMFIVENSTLLFVILLFITAAVSLNNKRQLNRLHKLKRTEHQFAAYERYYRLKLIWNSFSVFVSGLLLVLTNKYWFFYLLLLEMFLSFAFYPTQKLIQTDLKNADIVVT
jgi:hypothetical protein